MDGNVNRPAEHKLSGYLFAVVEVLGDACIPMNSVRHISGDLPGPRYLVAENDACLTPLSRIKSFDSKLVPSTKKLRNGMGMVNGSISVVHQLHALVKQKCLDIVARVVKILARGDEAVGGSKEFRAVALVEMCTYRLLFG